MKKKNGYTAIDLLIVIIVFGAITVFTISRVSYALSDDKSEVYNLEVKLIKTQAKAYGEAKKEEINGSETITVKTLVTENYLQADDEDGNIIDPRNDRKTLNDKKIKITYDKEKDEIKVKYLED